MRKQLKSSCLAWNELVPSKTNNIASAQKLLVNFGTIDTYRAYQGFRLNHFLTRVTINLRLGAIQIIRDTFLPYVENIAF